MPKQSQAEKLLAHLSGGSTITSLEAYDLLGITQLSARITDLEAKGHVIEHEPIKVINRENELVRVIRYRIKPKDEGVLEFDDCNRSGCDGIMRRYDEPNCSCHINPPCANCTNAEHICDKCGFIVEQPW